MKVVVEVVDAFDLKPKHGQRSASPFVEVDFDGQRHRTQTKTKDLSPAWNETLVFNVADPARLPNQTITVSVYSDGVPVHSATAGGGHRPHHSNFLGRVRISGISVAPSPAEAPVQRFPLDKRGFFSRVCGDIALRVYAIPDSIADPLPPPLADPTSYTEANPSAGGDGGGETAERERNHSHRAADMEPRVFHSVGSAPRPVLAEEKYMRAEQPPPWAVAQPPGGINRRPPEFGLVETTPTVASRLGYRGRNKVASTYDLVEMMHYLYVSVVKARDLPHMDLTGSLDPYVEVKLGNYKGTTQFLEKNQNPVWHQVFAFPMEHLQANLVEVAVKDRDFLKDDFVGQVVFELSDVPHRVPPDSPLAPQWYRLNDRSGEKVSRGDIMLAIWVGTQADEAFPTAWHSDAHSVGHDGVRHTHSSVYFTPRLCYLHVQVIEAQDLVPADHSRPPEATVRVQLGHQIRRARSSASHSINPTWNEDIMLVAVEPFDELLVITVDDRGEPIGRVVVPLSRVPQQAEHGKPVESRWFNLTSPHSAEEEEEKKKKKELKFSSKIHLLLRLELGYHVLDESTHYSSDLRPYSSKHHPKPSIGILELGILSARNLMPMKATKDKDKDLDGHGRTTDAYCVAKYGNKWVRTRTLINTLAPRWNEQYTWEVFDPCTVVTVAVFDNSHVAAHKDGGVAHDQRIGKVRIRLSTIGTDRVYTHYYPLLVLKTSGLKMTGQLHLAVRFTCKSWVNMVALYSKPPLPKMHYIRPIPIYHVELLRHHAMQIVAARLARAEPPLRQEVIEYMLDTDSHMWSMRRSKANFDRIISVLSAVAALGRWFDGVNSWKNPVTTIMVHVLFLILVCYPELILPTVFFYMFLIGVFNYRRRPRDPPHMDTRMSHAEWATAEVLDEEFDAFPTRQEHSKVRMRYDRLRSLLGRVQATAGDLATQGERALALLSWRDPRATAIFIFFSLVSAIVLYATPFQAVAAVVGLYVLRHPRFRSRMPSVAFNFYKRLPSKSDMLM